MRYRFHPDIEAAWRGVARSQSYRHVLGGCMWSGATQPRLEVLPLPRRREPWPWVLAWAVAVVIVLSVAP